MKYESLIKRLFDVVSVSGDEFLCKCPWHTEGRKPNLYVNGVKGVFCCQSCGKKGHLRKIASNMPVASTADIRARLRMLNDKTSNQQRVYPETWLAQFANEHPYWERRGISDDMVARFDLGYSPLSDYLTIPVRDPRGNLLGVIQRVLDNTKPKYRYPKGFPIRKHLFASWMIKDQRTVALVEGSLDAVACWSARVPALGLYGSRITEEQVRLLVRLGIHQVVIFTDNDVAGREAVPQITGALRGTGIVVRVAKYRAYWAAKDPGDLAPEQIRKAYHSATAQGVRNRVERRTA